MKIGKIILIGAVCVSAILASSCASAAKAAASTGPKSASDTLKNTSVEEQPTKQLILDWANRSTGEDARPAWLKSLVKGNSRAFKSEYGINDSDVVRYTVFENANKNVAETVADVQFAAQLANELRRDVMSEMGASLNDANEFEVVNNAATRAKVTIGGFRRAADFWQQIETDNKETGEKERNYIYYIIYDFSPTVWNQVVAKYLYDIVGQVPDSKAKQKIGSMMNEMKADAQNEKDRQQELSDRDFLAQQQARQQVVDLIANGQNTQAAASIAASYQSGDPAKQAAASVTPADTDWVKALSAASGAMF
jgi:hypothetical protein